ncbi:microprocessor complex subunit DGCR8 [Paragonimus westermani]|uniref:Microprocessor complex subunit DGCR8 n=1 Tax=Paragonimus westermani TaxID=34504 RepID=A0A5J4NSW6_9TREM|nr:microprocessor complex subunit DGCR8 [Paragonimus westermani]
MFLDNDQLSSYSVEIPSDPNQEFSKRKSSTNRAGRYIIRDLTDSVDFGLLPEGWIRLRHASGLTLYFHRPTRVVTVSRPYSVGSGSVRYHRIPLSAIPCLAYRKACEQDSANNTGVQEAITLSDTAVDTVGEQHNQQLDSVEVCDEKAVTPSDNLSPRFPLNCNRPSDEDRYQRASEISTSFSTSSNDKFLDREEGELSSADEDDETCSVQRSSKGGYCESETPAKRSRLSDVVDQSSSSARSATSTEQMVTSAPLDVSVVTVKSGAVPGKRRRRRRVPNTTGLRCQAVRPVGGKTDSTAGSHSLDKEKDGSKELMSVKTQVFSVKDKEMEYLLTSEEIRAYCSRLFEVKVDETPAPKNVDREAVCNEKESAESHSRVLMMPEEAKVIRYQLPPVEGDPTRRQMKEGLINMTGKSYVCILHEYCQNVLRRPPTYQTVVLENDRNPYQLTVVIDGKPYAAGVGQSKKHARLEAARNALSRLIPDFDKIVGSDNHTTGPPVASERDIQLFDDILVTDPRLYEMSVRMAFPTPYNLLVECLNRSCVPETELKSNMTSHGRSKHFFSLQLREHTVKVPCKNKREGRHLAAQHLLSRLHPEITVWAGLLRVYGPGSKPDKRGELETIQDAQNQEKSTVKTSLIRLLKCKMRELATQWEKGGGELHPKGKFFVSPDNLPVVTFHPDSKTDLYNSIPTPHTSSKSSDCASSPLHIASD